MWYKFLSNIKCLFEDNTLSFSTFPRLATMPSAVEKGSWKKLRNA